jgi:hypothetical protein
MRASEKTVGLAVERALRGTSGSIRVVRAAKIPVALPASVVEDEAGLAARMAVVDAQTLRTTLGPLLASAPPGLRVVIVTPLARPGGRGLVGRLTASARRLAPTELVDACEALRHSGVVEVRVIDVAGALGLAVLSGRTTSG